MLAIVEATPLITTDRRLLVEEAVAVLMMVEVAVTPFVELVITLAEEDKVLELTKLVNTEETPFTIVAKVLVVVESVLLLMILLFEVRPFTLIPKLLTADEVVALVIIEEVAEIPFTVEVNILPVAD